ncbi:MFS multidrug transporter-like protein [Hypoxylon sp. FL0890]|nr:MFS multidrug transporter-like protein [Hypoxylon sp. FL0890]
MAPVIGGILYEKTGYSGVFGVGAGALGLDFVMRLLVVEKKIAAKFCDKPPQDPRAEHQNTHNGYGTLQYDGAEDGDREESADESDALLPNKKQEDEDQYKIYHEPNRVVRALPILVCFRSPRLIVGFNIAFVQACFLAVFDATIPTEAHRLFGFTSLQAGLLFIALDIPYLLLGPVAGWAVDRYGTKLLATVGFGYLVPVLILLRLPTDHLLSGKNNIILYCALLALNGVGLAIVGSPGVVETSAVVQKFNKANPGFFGANGPYAQLYGFNSLFFCAGLTVGPVVAGALRDGVGYGNMNLVFAILAAVTATLSFFVVGGKPRKNFLRRLWNGTNTR